MAGGEEGPAGVWERTIKHPCVRMGGGRHLHNHVCLDLLLVAILNLSGSQLGNLVLKPECKMGVGVEAC